MSSLDYELKGGRILFQFVSVVNSIFFILFNILDFSFAVDSSVSGDLGVFLFSAFHGLWFYFESVIFLLSGFYILFFLRNRLSFVQRFGIFLFLFSFLYLIFEVIFGSWDEYLFPSWMFVGLFLFWLSLNLVYDDGFLFFILSFGASFPFLVQFFLYKLGSFERYFLGIGNYYDRLVLFGMVKMWLEIFWFFGLIFLWYLSFTFRGIPVLLESKKEFVPYDPLYPLG